MDSPSSIKRNIEPSPVRVGLIGATGYGFAYYEELTRLAGLGLIEWGAATIINPEDAVEPMTFFRENNIPVYDDYREMLEKESGNIDWVCVPTAISWHEQMTIDSLRKGLPVLLEKPMAPTLRGVEAIQQVEAETGQLVAIGFQHCCSRDTLKVKKRLLEGVIGEIQRVEALCLWPRAVSYYQRNNWAGCVADENGWVLDSPLHNALSHLVNLILFFTGKSMHERADVVSMEAELYRAKPIQNFDTVRCVGKLDTGVEASLILSHSSLEKMDPEIRIHGSKGVYVWRFGEPHTFEFDGNVEPLEVESPLDVRAYMFDSIVRILQGDSGIPYCTTEHAKGEVKWVNAVQDAAVTQTIAQEFCRQVEDSEGEVSDTVVDLKRYAVEAYQRNCSFKEAGAPWAIEASQLDLHGYTSFMGRHLDAYRPVLPV